MEYFRKYLNAPQGTAGQPTGVDTVNDEILSLFPVVKAVRNRICISFHSFLSDTCYLPAVRIFSTACVKRKHIVLKCQSCIYSNLI